MSPRKADPEWEERISRLYDCIKGMAMLLPRDKTRFGTAMVMANMMVSLGDKNHLRFSRRLAIPGHGETDIEVADRLLNTYEDLLDPEKPRIKFVQHMPDSPGPAEEITEERMIQVAAALNSRRAEGSIARSLYLARCLGAEVDFAFSEFPSCPYSRGVQKHLEEGKRIGAFGWAVAQRSRILRVRDRSLLAKAEPKLLKALKWIRNKKANIRTEALAATFCFNFVRKYWGPRTFYRIAERECSVDTQWGPGRKLAITIAKRGHIDMSFLPATILKKHWIPSLAGCPRWPYLGTQINNWWMDVLSSLLRSFRRGQDIAANGLRTLWPQS
jgi:hypothetical protein